MDLEGTGPGRNLNLDMGEFTDIGTLSHNSGLTSWQGHLEPVLVCCWNGSLKLGNNKAYIVNEVELLELP